MAKRAQQTALVAAAGICLVLAGAATLFYISSLPAADAGDASEPPAAEATVQALDQSAEERAYEAMRKIPVVAETAGDGVDEEAPGRTAGAPSQPRLTKDLRRSADKGHLPPTTLALNCERLRKAYSNDELQKIPGFKEKCEG